MPAVERKISQNKVAREGTAGYGGYMLNGWIPTRHEKSKVQTVYRKELHESIK